MTAVTEKLLDEGIKLFEDAMTSLLAGIDKARSAIVTGRPPTIDASLPPEFEATEVDAHRPRGLRRTSRSASGSATPVAVGRARACPRSRTASAG